jgi:hypothetical protein
MAAHSSWSAKNGQANPLEAQQEKKVTNIHCLRAPPAPSPIPDSGMLARIRWRLERLYETFVCYIWVSENELRIANRGKNMEQNRAKESVISVASVT